MKIHLEELDHQRLALEALLGAVSPLCEEEGMVAPFANPLLKEAGKEDYFIDIKMETGTGKTYVYIRTMYELHKKLGLFKFVIVVPSLAIKEGTRNFIESDYANQHYAKFYPGNRINLQLISGGDFTHKRGRRKNFPSSLTGFCEAEKNERNMIQCLLINTQMLISKGFQDDTYDQTLFGDTSSPLEAVRETRPIVIIDEPHRIKRDSAGYKAIMALDPQLIIRFGATFPELRRGRGRTAIVKTDYYRDAPQYDLGAVEAFNQDLVKGVAVQFPNLPEKAANRFKVSSVTAKELVLTKRSAKQSSAKEYRVLAGECLSTATAADFGGVSYEGGKLLSNELELAAGMELVAGVFSNTYQEMLLAQALDEHFKVEQANFERKAGYRIKTNALFFIDSIDSYRHPDGWLKAKFEELLRRKLEQLLDPDNAAFISAAYRSFLEATKADLSLAHGGYFARDWGEPDDSATAEERDDILHKERTLPFKRVDGSWNVRRFFFSKWTLREGWDNPNVFTICKLRTSGSEISKIQEVGRGLRLPVDEMGNRLRGSEWQLNYIIGWDERSFTEKLVGEINADAKLQLDSNRLTDIMRETICQVRKIEANELLKQLDAEKIIERDNSFTADGYERLLKLYPELLQTQVKQGKITTAGAKQRRPQIKLRQDNWRVIAESWRKLSKRYLLALERLPEDDLSTLVEEVFNSSGVFEANSGATVTVQELRKHAATEELTVVAKEISIANPGLTGKLGYGEFVKRFARRSGLKIELIHTALWHMFQKQVDAGTSKREINAALNLKSLEKALGVWEEKFAETYATKYDYYPLDFEAETSLIKDGSFVDQIESGLIGINLSNAISDDPRNLYEMPRAYDSEIEREIETFVPDKKVVVFGKIPRRAIRVPTYTGGSTTPDFVYYIADGTSGKSTGEVQEEAAAKKYGEKNTLNRLTLLIETKASDMRLSERRVVAAQKRLFKTIPGVEWRLITSLDELRSFLCASSEKWRMGGERQVLSDEYEEQQ